MYSLQEKKEFWVKKHRPYDPIHLLFAISNYLKHNVTLKHTFGVQHSLLTDCYDVCQGDLHKTCFF